MRKVFKSDINVRLKLGNQAHIECLIATFLSIESPNYPVLHPDKHASLFINSLYKKEVIRSLFLREISMAQDESCGANGFSYREGSLKVALQRRRIAWNFFLNSMKVAVVSQSSQIPEFMQDHFHISSGGAAPGTRLLWKGNSLLSPNAGRGLVPSTR